METSPTSGLKKRGRLPATEASCETVRNNIEVRLIYSLYIYSLILYIYSYQACIPIFIII